MSQRDSASEISMRPARTRLIEARRCVRAPQRALGPPLAAYIVLGAKRQPSDRLSKVAGMPRTSNGAE